MTTRGFATGHTVLLVLTAAYLSPIIWAAWSSTDGTSAVESHARAWAALEPGVTLWNTAALAIAGAAVAVGVSAGLAFVLVEAGSRVRGAALAGLLALTFAPRHLALVPLIGLVAAFGIERSLAAPVLTSAAAAIPMQVLLFEANLRGRCRDHLTLFTIVGVRPIDRFLLLLPLVRRLIGGLLLLEILRLTTTFFLPFVLTLGRPSLQTMSVRVYELAAMYPNDRAVLLAAVLQSSLPALLLLAFSPAAKRRVVG